MNWDDLIESTNDYWNRRIKYDDYEGPNRTMLEAVTKGGKCHDYVKAKGARLVGLGFPRERLSVGIGYVGHEPHSVLLVDGRVLDNRQSRTYREDELEKAGMTVTDRIPFKEFGI